MNEEFLRLQYDHLRKVIDENVSQRRRLQEYVLAFIVALYAWIVLNGTKLASLPPNALFWMRWLPTLVIVGAAARWLGHQIVIQVVAAHMRSIETYFRIHHLDDAQVAGKNMTPSEKMDVADAILGYESAINARFSKARAAGFLSRFPASSSEFVIGVLAFALTIAVALALGEIQRPATP